VPTVTYTRDASDSIVERKVNGVSTALSTGTKRGATTF
jgi:hypothetical protein